MDTSFLLLLLLFGCCVLWLWSWWSWKWLWWLRLAVVGCRLFCCVGKFQRQVLILRFTIRTVKRQPLSILFTDGEARDELRFAIRSNTYCFPQRIAKQTLPVFLYMSSLASPSSTLRHSSSRKRYSRKRCERSFSSPSLSASSSPTACGKRPRMSGTQGGGAVTFCTSCTAFCGSGGGGASRGPAPA